MTSRGVGGRTQEQGLWKSQDPGQEGGARAPPTGISALLSAPRASELPLGHCLSSLPHPPSGHYFPPDMGTCVRNCACMWLDEKPLPHRRVSSLGDGCLDVGCTDLFLHIPFSLPMSLLHPAWLPSAPAEGAGLGVMGGHRALKQD